MDKKSKTLRTTESKLRSILNKQTQNGAQQKIDSFDNVNSLKNEYYFSGVISDYIFDVSKGYFSYVDESFYTITGYHPIEVVNSDVVDFLSKIICEEHFLVIPGLIEKSFQLSKENHNKKNIFFNLEYNIISRAGEKKRILGQFKTILFEEDGYPKINFCRLTDITHIKKDGIPVMYAVAENEIIHFEQALANEMLNSHNVILSKKEIQILTLISQGYNMKEVAFLTKNKVSTIYTHRKNIRSKYNIEISSLILDLKEQGII